MKARCGHLIGSKYAKAHDGLCRRCHSYLAFLITLEWEYGEDALVQYWVFADLFLADGRHARIRLLERALG